MQRTYDGWVFRYVRLLKVRFGRFEEKTIHFYYRSRKGWGI